ncbi:sigma-E factor negative regulatory protein [Sessilibacter sp. MAH4]
MAQINDKSMFDETLKQSLSALMDGEASELEVRRLLQQSDKDAEVRETWSRYQLAGRLLRGEQAAVPMIDLSASISELISEEETHSVAAPVEKKAGLSRFFGHAGRAAIAASVAVVAVFVVNTYQDAPSEGAAPVVAEIQAPASSNNDAANLPIGYGTDGLSARTVSTDSSRYDEKRRSAQPVQFIPRTDSRTGQSEVSNAVVEEMLRQLMIEHANTGMSTQGDVPFERLPRIESEQ